MPNKDTSLACTNTLPAVAARPLHRVLSWMADFTSARRTAVGADTSLAPLVPLAPQALLKRLLDRHPQARVVFSNLTAIETCLHLEGLAGLAEMSVSALESAQAELRSISGEPDVQPLLELLDIALCSPPEAAHAPAFQPRAIATSALPYIENLDVDEVDEETYLSALVEWEQSALTGCSAWEGGCAR